MLWLLWLLIAYLLIGAIFGAIAIWGTSGMNTVNRPFLFLMFMTCWPIVVAFYLFGGQR